MWLCTGFNEKINIDGKWLYFEKISWHGSDLKTVNGWCHFIKYQHINYLNKIILVTSIISYHISCSLKQLFITRGGSWSRWWPDTKPVLAILFRTWRTHRKRNTMVTMDTYKRSRWIDSFLHFQWPREGCVECSGPWIRYKWTIRKSFWGCTRQTSDITYS